MNNYVSISIRTAGHCFAYAHHVIKGKKRVPISKNVDPLKISINDAKDILKIKK